MKQNTGPVNRENHSRRSFKADIEDQFLEFELKSSEYKAQISEEAGVSTQYVRKWFREKEFTHEQIEAAAWRCLARAKADYTSRNSGRASKLKKLAS